MLSDELMGNPVAYRSMRQMQEQGVRLRLIYDDVAEAATDSGLFRIGDDGLAYADIFMRNGDNATIGGVMDSIVHEASHAQRWFRTGGTGGQVGEYLARAREQLYRTGKRPTRSQRADIWREMLRHPEYRRLPRR